MLCHTSREEEVMRECDIHHTRSIKINSAVKLSRMPGLDLRCDLPQHVQGKPRTCSFYIIIRTSILLVPSLKLYFFHMKCNQIQFSYHKDGSFCSILFIMFNVYQVCHAYLTPPSMRVTYYPIDPGSTQGSHRPTSFTSNNLLL